VLITSRDTAEHTAEGHVMQHFVHLLILEVCPHRHSKEGTPVFPDTLIQHFNILLIRRAFEMDLLGPLLSSCPNHRRCRHANTRK